MSDTEAMYAAECECCRLEALSQEADNTARRLRVEYHAAVMRLRELVRVSCEPAAEPEPPTEMKTKSMLDLFAEAQ